jgi:LPS O-antigen subunit length determinant protein (WzzB/FepE family)
MQSFFVQKKTILIEAVVLILFLFGMYYLYTSFSEESATVTPSAINEQLLGQNFILFLKVINQDRISFRDTSFMNSELVKQLRDFSEEIGMNDTRGRVDPFVPYASSRPLR